MGFLSMLRKSRKLPLHHSLPPVLFPIQECTMSVSAWASRIQDLVESQECRLRRIVHCRVKSGSHDEFLLIYVRHPSDKDTIVLADRDTTFDPSSAYTDENIPPSHSQIDVRMLGIAPSRDRIWLSSDGTKASLTRRILGGWAEIYTVEFRKASKAPSVAHLAVLLMVVHQHAMSPGASVEVRSGWFAYCVAEVMRETFLGVSKANKGWARVPYGGMRVESKDTVSALTREFMVAWGDFSRRQTVRLTERRSEEVKRAKKKAGTDSFVNMLRTMDL